MAISLLTSALLAGSFAAAVAFAPVAMADEGPDTVSRGPNAAEVKKRPGPNAGTNDYSSRQIPQGWRNDAVWGNPSKPGSNPFGKGPRPPVIALD